MAQVGQTTPSGGREWGIYPQQAACRAVTVPVNCTLNHIGVWCREQTTPNSNDLRGAIYTAAGALVYQTSILTGAIDSASSHALKQLAFASQALSAGNYIIVVSAGPDAAIVQGQNGPGGEPVSMHADSPFFPDFPADTSALLDTTATRQWDLYLDYSEDSSRTGSLAGTESGADDFDAAGTVGSNGLRLILRDTDTGALAANLTGLIVAIRSSSNAESTLYSTTSGTTSASGIYQLASSSIGDIGDYVYVSIELSDHSVVAMYRVQVIDLNA